MTVARRYITLQFLSRMMLALLACALLWFALRGLSLADLWATLRRLTLSEIGALLLANGLILLLLITRWHLFLSVQGHRLPLRKLFGYRLAAFGVSYFTPGPQFGGEPLQVYLVTRQHNVPRADAIAAVTLDKLLELLSNFTFLVGAIFFVFQRQLLPALPGGQAMLYALLLLALPCWLLIALWSGRHPISGLLQNILTMGPSRKAAWSHWIESIYQSERQVAAICQTRPSIIGIASLLSVVIWVLMLAEFWLMTYLLGFGLSLTQAITLLVAARVAILLPMPAGLGVLEASFVLVMGRLGLGATEAISLSLLIRSRDILLGLAGLYLGMRMYGSQNRIEGYPEEEPFKDPHRMQA